MVRLFLGCLGGVILAGASWADPIWDVSDAWTCDLERHMRIPLGRAVVEMDPAGKSYAIDFQAGTVTSAFVEDVGRITGRSHHASSYGTHHILVVDWGSAELGRSVPMQLGWIRLYEERTESLRTSTSRPAT